MGIKSVPGVARGRVHLLIGMVHGAGIRMLPIVSSGFLFDCRGRTNNKYAKVDMKGEGEDYLHRKVRMTLQYVWSFDAATAAYVLE